MWFAFLGLKCYVSLKKRTPRVFEFGWTSEVLFRPRLGDLETWPSKLMSELGFESKEKCLDSAQNRVGTQMFIPFFFLTFWLGFFLGWPTCPCFQGIFSVLALTVLSVGNLPQSWQTRNICYPRFLTVFLSPPCFPSSLWELRACRQSWNYFLRKQNIYIFTWV